MKLHLYLVKAMVKAAIKVAVLMLAKVVVNTANQSGSTDNKSRGKRAFDSGSAPKSRDVTRDWKPQ